MATVKILYDDSAKDLEEYLKRNFDHEGPTTEHFCFLKGMTKEFSQVQSDFNSPGNNSIHLIQSWSYQESKQLTREKIHEMGLELVNRFAPGHQFVVQTHTDRPSHHNHIVLNPVNLETGKRIQNKLEHIKTIRNLNDDIAKSHGLSVLPPQEKLRSKGPNEVARRIDAYRGRSYVVDMATKADFSRHHATNYDEYVAILNTFDIQVRIEPKNITYFYPGRTHGKRGRNLGPELDKPGLEKKFEANQERFQNSPELKKTTAELISAYRAPPRELSTEEQLPKQVTQLLSTRAEGVTTPRGQELETSFIPIEEIQKAKMQSILKYCEKEKINLLLDDSGRTVLRGREYVEVSDYSWINHKNKTKGNIIDFVATHHQTGYLKAVSQINDNPKLMLLEKHLGEAKRRYQPFYIPREDIAPRAAATQHLVRLLGHAPSHSVYGELFKRQCVHVTNRGLIRFFSDKEPSGFIEYEPDSTRGYHTSRHGLFTGPFLVRPSRSGEISVFTDPKTFLKKEPTAFLKSASNDRGILVLFEPDLAVAQKALVTQKNLKRVKVLQNDSQASPELLKFYTELKDSLNPFCIETELAWEPIRVMSFLAPQYNTDLSLNL